MRTPILTILALSLCQILSAQKSIDLVTLSGTYGLPVGYEAPVTEKGTELRSNISLTLPAVLSEKTIFYNNINYYYFGIQNKASFDDTIANPIGVSGIILRTGIVQKINDKHGFQILFVPRLMSDFKNVGSNAFQFGGIAMYERVYSDDFTLRLGVLYNQEFSGPYLVPLVYLDWNITDKISFVGLLPVYMKIKYKQSERFEFGIGHFGLMTTFRLGHEDYKNDYLVRQSIDLYLYERFHIGSNIHFETRLGYSLGRTYAQYKEDDKVSLSIPLATFGDNRTQANIPIDNGAFINVRLVYNLPLDD